MSEGQNAAVSDVPGSLRGRPPAGYESSEAVLESVTATVEPVGERWSPLGDDGATGGALDESGVVEFPQRVAHLVSGELRPIGQFRYADWFPVLDRL